MATGGAGAHLESRVAADCLASVLVGGPVRGLPDHVARAVRVQRAYEGHPLDDVIVDADGTGDPATLSLQVKRSFTFGQSPLFQEVMKQCWGTFSAPSFRHGRDRFGTAIGTATGADDDRRTVLEWARQSADAADFHGRIRASGFANDRMRTGPRDRPSTTTPAGVSSSTSSWSTSTSSTSRPRATTRTPSTGSGPPWTLGRTAEPPISGRPSWPRRTP